MKRILFVSAGTPFSKGALAFLKSMQEEEPIQVTGLFFSHIDYNAMISVSHIPAATPYVRLQEQEQHDVQADKAVFARFCADHYLKYQIHPNHDAWDRHLFARTSRFSDLVILSGELFYKGVEASQPNLFMQEALHAAECPVMVVPEDYTPVEHLVIGYDGSRNSLHAIKQFCYLFPSYTELPTEFVYIKDEASQEIPDIELIRDFSAWHFGSIGFSKLHTKAAHYFTDWIRKKQQVMLVCGSFGRSPFSYMAKSSFASQAIHEHKIPVFIAHI